MTFNIGDKVVPTEYDPTNSLPTNSLYGIINSESYVKPNGVTVHDVKVFSTNGFYNGEIFSIRIDQLQLMKHDVENLGGAYN